MSSVDESRVGQPRKNMFNASEHHVEDDYAMDGRDDRSHDFGSISFFLFCFVYAVTQ